MTKDYYKILEVSKTASVDEIKKAFLRLVKQHQDSERLKEILEAYDVLSNPAKRRSFDLRGDDFRSSAGTSFGFGPRSNDFVDPMSTFDQFFGDSNAFGSSGLDGSEDMFDRLIGSQNRKNDPIEHEVFVTLEEVNEGCTKRIPIKRYVQDWNGMPVREEKVFSVPIKPGLKAGAKITFAKEGNHIYGDTPSDVVFTVREKPHPTFVRDGSDLRYTASLLDSVSLKTLWSRTIPIQTLSGKALNIPLMDHLDDERRMRGQGLPHPDEPSKRGDIIVKFTRT